MILEDIRLGPALEHFPWAHFVIPTVALGIVLAADVLLRLRASKKLVFKGKIVE